MTQPFYFPDGRLANNANDLLELCKQYPDDATNFLVKEDLEKWLAYIGSHDVAACAANARQTDLGDRQKLEEFLTRCHALTAAKPVATPETSETPQKENESVSESEAPTAVPPEAVVATPPVAQPESVAEPTPLPVPETITPTPPTTPPSVTPTAVKPPVNSNATENEEKPGFFQVVAKFIMRIFYRDQA